MSTGNFVGTKYEADDGKIFPIRLQPETLDLTLNSVENDPPAGGVTSGLPTVKVSTGTRQFGVRPRGVVIQLTADGSGAVADYDSGSEYRVTVLKKSVWEGIAKEQTGTYLGIACKVVSKYSENIR